jgi:hypothetical protein
MLRLILAAAILSSACGADPYEAMHEREIECGIHDGYVPRSASSGARRDARDIGEGLRQAAEDHPELCGEYVAARELHAWCVLEHVSCEEHAIARWTQLDQCDVTPREPLRDGRQECCVPRSPSHLCEGYI